MKMIKQHKNRYSVIKCYLSYRVSIVYIGNSSELQNSSNATLKTLCFIYPNVSHGASSLLN